MILNTISEIGMAAALKDSKIPAHEISPPGHSRNFADPDNPISKDTKSTCFG